MHCISIQIHSSYIICIHVDTYYIEIYSDMTCVYLCMLVFMHIISVMYLNTYLAHLIASERLCGTQESEPFEPDGVEDQ